MERLSGLRRMPTCVCGNGPTGVWATPRNKAIDYLALIAEGKAEIGDTQVASIARTDTAAATIDAAGKLSVML